jgi:site-specific DNA-cytosine methylase
MIFFTKSKRAQNVDDFETWIQGGVSPTLNAMDNNGEVFATVLILAIDFYNIAIDERNFHTLRSGGANEGKPGVLIIDGTRVNDVRVYEDGIVPTVISRYGTGGGNVPMIFDNSEPNETIAFDTQFGSNANTLENVSPTLKASQQPPSFIETIPIQGTVIGRADTSGPQGKGFSQDGSPMFTLTSTDVHAVAVDFYNASTGDTSQTLRAHTATAMNIGGVIDHQVVRRLTPKECERLQGFPDDWTADQADSNRYKQCGNAVAVPVVEWIITRIISATN